MKRIYSSALDDALKARIPVELPGFRPISPKAPASNRSTSNLTKTDLVFERIGEPLSLYLIFSKHPRQEEFNLSLGWSDQRGYPIDIERPSTSISPDGSELTLGRAIVGFYELFPAVTGRSHLGWAVWKCSVDFDHPDFRRIFVQEDLAPVSLESAVERVNHAIDECIGDIQAVAIPYFQRLLETHRAN